MTLHNIHIELYRKKTNRFLWQVIISHAWTTNFLSRSHMSHMTPNLYIAAAEVVVNSVRSSSFCLRLSSISNLQEQTTSTLESIYDSLLSSLIFFLFDHHLISDSDDNTFYPYRMCYLHKWYKKAYRTTNHVDDGSELIVRWQW
jgi:hypothetical protein